MYPLPRPRAALSAATIWAISDFTADNGATVVIPGSHRWDDTRRPTDADEHVSIVMPAGSVVFFVGTLWHGAARTVPPIKVGSPSPRSTVSHGCVPRRHSPCRHRLKRFGGCRRVSAGCSATAFTRRSWAWSTACTPSGSSKIPASQAIWVAGQRPAHCTNGDNVAYPPSNVVDTIAGNDLPRRAWQQSYTPTARCRWPGQTPDMSYQRSPARQSQISAADSSNRWPVLTVGKTKIRSVGL